MKIAVVGAGITGLTAALSLSKTHEVVLFNDERRPGGHAHTRILELSDGPCAVDSGFIVYNELNYPHFTKLLQHLDVKTAPSDMTFAVSADQGRLEYKGGLGLSALFAQRRNFLRPQFYRLLRAIVRFHALGNEALTSQGGVPPTVAEFLQAKGLDKTNLARDYLYPMMAAIWSGKSAAMGAMSTLTFLNFFKNHGLLSIGGKHPWRTVRGGSKTYVQALLDTLCFETRFGCALRSIQRMPGRAILVDHKGGHHAFDEVVLALHSNQALSLLGNGATAQERAVLSAMSYASNQAYLHTDPALMPRRKGAWASWNYLRAAGVRGLEDSPVSLTYWMNNLQPLTTCQQVFLTLNPAQLPKEETILAQWSVMHPQFGSASTAAQAHLKNIQGTHHTWFAGAWAGYGFHEDGCQAGVSIGAALGGSVPWQVASVSSAAACVAPDALALR